MLAHLRVRDLLIASWETERSAVERALPAGLDPADVEGRFLVSLAAFRVVGGRLGRFPVAPYSQLNARTYALWRGEPAVFFLAARVSTFGLAGRILGAPFRQARLRFRAGSARAPGLGLALVYRVAEPIEAGLLGRHEVGLFEWRGLRALHIRRGAAVWHRAVLTAPPRSDFLFAVGFEPRAEPELLYAPSASFEADVPPLEISGPAPP